MFILFFFCFYWNHLREEKSRSVQVLCQQFRGGWGVKACADNADVGGGGGGGGGTIRLKANLSPIN